VSDEAAIEVENLVREFRKGPRAVDGIDLAVSPGEIYGFLGPNGAGKSTTVLMLTTLLPPTSGRATVGGFDIARQGAQVRATIGRPRPPGGLAGQSGHCIRRSGRCGPRAVGVCSPGPCVRGAGGVSPNRAGRFRGDAGVRRGDPSVA
jgi:energy-coupling factor transporter ATP-binding protein EcfA2